jgi:hypothetical protein
MDSKQVNPVEQLKNDIDSAKRDFSSLLSNSNLNSIRDEFSDLDTKIANMGLRIQKIRDRKYLYNKIAEQQSAEYQKQWATKKFNIQNRIETETRNLQVNIRPLEMRVSGLRIGAASPAIVQSVNGDIDRFKVRVSAAERAIRELFEGLKSEVEKLNTQLNLVEVTLDNSETASFGFLPGEGVIMAVKAVWTRDDKKEDKGDPEGILFLTDQRLIFEQKEEIATKKVLFVTAERELVQKLQFETPVVSIESVKATKQGLFKNEDWIEMVLTSGSFSREVKLHLDGQNSEEWQKLITKARTKDFDSDRTVAVDQAAVEKVKTAPSQCPNCGGTITKPVLRGQDTITCEFCGNVIRL